MPLGRQMIQLTTHGCSDWQSFAQQLARLLAARWSSAWAPSWAALLPELLPSANACQRDGAAALVFITSHFAAVPARPPRHPAGKARRRHTMFDLHVIQPICGGCGSGPCNPLNALCYEQP